MTNRTEKKQINFRVTEEEYQRINSMANDIGLSVSAYCKITCKGIKTKTPNINREGAHQIASELRKISSNVNQVAPKTP